MNQCARFRSDVHRVLASTDAYRLSRVRLHEAFARLFLYKGVNDSVTIQEATTNTVQELESVLPTAAPAGCSHYSKDDIQHSLAHALTDDRDADNLVSQIFHMLDTYYLSQTASDPYSEFLAMHWKQGVTWEAYVLTIIRFAKKYKFFQRMSEYGHQGAAPTNMDADQVVMRINELQRCVLEDGGASVAGDLYTLYALDKKHVITGPQELLEDLALRSAFKNACRTTPQVLLDDLALRAPTPDEEGDFGIDTNNEG